MELAGGVRQAVRPGQSVPDGGCPWPEHSPRRRLGSWSGSLCRRPVWACDDSSLRERRRPGQYLYLASRSRRLSLRPCVLRSPSQHSDVVQQQRLHAPSRSCVPLPVRAASDQPRHPTIGVHSNHHDPVAPRPNRSTRRRACPFTPSPSKRPFAR